MTDHSVVVQEMVRGHDRLFNGFRDGLCGQVFPFVVIGVYEGITSNIDNYGDPWEDHNVLFVLYLLYLHYLYH